MKAMSFVLNVTDVYYDFLLHDKKLVVIMIPTRFVGVELPRMLTTKPPPYLKYLGTALNFNVRFRRIKRRLKDFKVFFNSAKPS